MGDRTAAKVRRVLARHRFCTVATSGPGRPPHVSGAMYVLVEDALYFATLRSGVKARNISESGRAAVCVAVRRIPFAPPFCVHFQARAELLAADDAELVRLLDAGLLKRITAHGELEEPDNCFVRLRPGRRVVSYGIGVPLRELVRDPLHATRSVEVF